MKTPKTTTDRARQFFFPYRFYLESQIEELKATISQNQRKYDSLVEELLALKKPKLPVQPIDLKRVTTRVVGWDDYRTQLRNNAGTEDKNPEPPKEQSDGPNS